MPDLQYSVCQLIDILLMYCLSGQGQHPAPHVDDQGSVGLDENIQAAKIDPLVSQVQAEATKPASGLRDEQVDAARIQPMGEVREDIA